MHTNVQLNRWWNSAACKWMQKEVYITPFVLWFWDEEWIDKFIQMSKIIHSDFAFQWSHSSAYFRPLATFLIARTEKKNKIALHIAFGFASFFICFTTSILAAIEILNVNRSDLMHLRPQNVYEWDLCGMFKQNRLSIKLAYWKRFAIQFALKTQVGISSRLSDRPRFLLLALYPSWWDAE